MGHGGKARRLGLALAVGIGLALAVGLLAAAWFGPSTMRIVNRTQVVLSVGTGSSTLVVQPCSERTVQLVGPVWGGDGSGRRHDEEPPAGAYVLELHDWAVVPPIEGRNDRTIVITSGYVGYTVGTADPIAIAGPASFPADAAAVECAGAPPPQPSRSPSP